MLDVYVFLGFFYSSLPSWFFPVLKCYIPLHSAYHLYFQYSSCHTRLLVANTLVILDGLTFNCNLEINYFLVPILICFVKYHYRPIQSISSKYHTTMFLNLKHVSHGKYAYKSHYIFFNFIMLVRKTVEGLLLKLKNSVLNSAVNWWQLMIGFWIFDLIIFNA